MYFYHGHAAIELFEGVYFSRKYNMHHKIVKSNTSHLEAHVDLFRLLMKGNFGPYVLHCDLLTKNLIFF